MFKYFKNVVIYFISLINDTNLYESAVTIARFSNSEFKRWCMACLLEQMEEDEKDREQILLTIFWLEGVCMPLIGLPGLLGKAT